MAQNVCPNCSQITLSLGLENNIKCPICGTVYDVEPEKINTEDIPVPRGILKTE